MHAHAARKVQERIYTKKDNVPILEDEEPVKKGKRLKTNAKKSAYKPATALTEEAQMKEVCKKCLRDFHKTHPSGSGTVAEDPLSVANITPPVTSEGTGDIPRVPDMTNNDSSKNSEQEEESEDDDQEENKDDDDLELESNDETEGDEEIDDTTDQFNDDADARLEEPIETATGIIFLILIPVHHEVPRTQAPTLLTIPVSVIPESSPIFTNIPQSSHTFTPPPTVETRNPLSNLPDFASIFQFNNRITTLEKEVDDLKKDPLHTQVTSLVDSHLDTRLGETREEFMNSISKSLTAIIKEQVSSQPPSCYEAVASLTEFELKKILIDKIEKSESYLTAPQHRECYDGLKKSYELDMDYFSSYDVYSLNKDAEPTNEPKNKDLTSGSSKPQPKSFGKSVQSEEPVFEVTDSSMPQDHEGIQGNNEEEPRKETTSIQDWFKKPTPQ
ncbi:hypothetical protein Tco_0904825 [Tanacetum coccineum]